jgi:hypothetical protein
MAGERMVSLGRFVLVVNEDLAPSTHRASMPLGIRLFLLVFLCLLAWASPPVGVGLMACLLCHEAQKQGRTVGDARS